MAAKRKSQELSADQIETLESVIEKASPPHEPSSHSQNDIEGFARLLGANPKVVTRYWSINFDLVTMLYTLGAFREMIVKKDGSFSIDDPLSKKYLECVENAIILCGMTIRLSAQEARKLIVRVIELELQRFTSQGKTKH